MGIEDSLFAIIFLAILSLLFLFLSIRAGKIVKRKTKPAFGRSYVGFTVGFGRIRYTYKRPKV